MNVVTSFEKNTKPDGYKVRAVIADVAHFRKAKEMSDEEYDLLKKRHRIVFTTSNFETTKQAFDAAYEELLFTIAARKNIRQTPNL